MGNFERFWVFEQDPDTILPKMEIVQNCQPRSPCTLRPRSRSPPCKSSSSSRKPSQIVAICLSTVTTMRSSQVVMKCIFPGDHSGYKMLFSAWQLCELQPSPARCDRLPWSPRQRQVCKEVRGRHGAHRTRTRGWPRALRRGQSWPGWPSWRRERKPGRDCFIAAIATFWQKHKTKRQICFTFIFTQPTALVKFQAFPRCDHCASVFSK